MLPRIAELRELLHRANQAYYNDAAPVMTDSEYDRLFDELAQLERANPGDADLNSPTARVGAPLPNGFAKTPHLRPMLSLSKVFTAAEALTALPLISEELWLEPKVDGASLSIIYHDGRLQRAVTRGDGTNGDDVTANVRTIRTVPLLIPRIGAVEVRGEVYLSRQRFKELNKEQVDKGEEPFANARNAAAGTLKQKDSKICARRGLSFIAYQLDDGTRQLTSQLIKIQLLERLGFQTTFSHGLMLSPAAEGLVGCEAQLQYALLEQFGVNRQQLPFDADGVVIKYNSVEVQERLGNANRSPRWAVAFKFENEKATTRLLDIKLTVGRTGQITPNAVLAPVELCGATIKAASLCNADEIARLGINVGDEVVVERCNDVIPKLVGLSSKRTDGIWLMPKTCPACQAALERCGVHFFCLNYRCPDRVFWRLRHAVGKGCLDWDGMGEESIRRLIGAGATKLSDLFSMAAPASFKTSAARKFLDGREAVKKAALWRKIHALGIDGVGQTSSKELCVKFGSLEAMVDAGWHGLLPVLGPVATESFLEFIRSNLVELEALDQYGFHFTAEIPAGSSQPTGPLAGKTFVITGTLTSGSRDQVASWIESHGGQVKGGVTKGVTYLVVGAGGGANKAAAAQKLGTACLSESELYALAGQEVPVAQVRCSADNI